MRPIGCVLLLPFDYWLKDGQNIISINYHFKWQKINDVKSILHTPILLLNNTRNISKKCKEYNQPIVRCYPEISRPAPWKLIKRFNYPLHSIGIQWASSKKIVCYFNL